MSARPLLRHLLTDEDRGHERARALALRFLLTARVRYPGAGAVVVLSRATEALTDSILPTLIKGPVSDARAAALGSVLLGESLDRALRRQPSRQTFAGMRGGRT